MKLRNIFYTFFIVLITIGLMLSLGCDRRDRETDISGGTTGPSVAGNQAVIGNVFVTPKSANVYVPKPDSTVSVTIEVTVIDTSGKRVSGVPTNFKSNLGTIVVEQDTTDNNGKVKAELFNVSESVPFSEGEATVTITIDAKNTVVKTADIQFINGIPENSTLQLSVNPTYLNANGDDNGIVKAILKDGQNRAITNVYVQFTTDKGLLTAPPEGVATNSNGVAQTTYMPVVGLSQIPIEPTPITISGEVSTITGSTNLVLLPPRNNGIKISATQTYIYAANGESITLNVSVRDTASNTAVEGAEVNFSSTAGLVSPATATTDAAGKATVTFFDDYTEADAPDSVITATVSAYSEGGADAIAITILPPTSDYMDILLTLEQSTIRGGKDEEVTVTAFLKDKESGVAIPNAKMNFTSDIGIITDSPVYTDVSGKALTSFKDGYSPETVPEEPVTATIVAQSGSASKAATLLIIPPEGLTPGSTLEITGTPTIIYANHDEEVNLTITVRDSQNVGIPNAEVELFTNVGLLDEYSLTTGVNGKAYTRFYDDYSDENLPDEPVVATIRAESAWLSSEFDVTINPPPGETTLILTTQPGWTYADGGQTTCTLTAKLFDAFGENIEGELVNFSTDIGMVVSPVLTDTFGIATTTFSDGFDVSPDSTLMTEVVAEWQEEGVKDTVDIEIIPAAPPIPASVDLTASTTELQVSGTGGQETAIITAFVYDQAGNPINDGHPVTFSIINSPGGGENLNNVGYEVVVPTNNGKAMATLYSGTSSGTVRIKAETDNGISATTTAITIVGGPPNEIIVSFDTEGEKIGGGLWQIEASAQVIDVHANPVPDSTAVFFSLYPDTLASVIGGTYTYNVMEGGSGPEHGVAYTLINYRSSAIFQEMQIIAQSDSVFGYSLPGSVFPIQDPSITVTANPQNIQFPAGSTTAKYSEIVATLVDGYSNPVMGGFLIMGTTHGEIHDAMPGYGDEEPTGYTNEEGELIRYLKVYATSFGNYAECTVTATLFGTDTDGDVTVYLIEEAEE